MWFQGFPSWQERKAILGGGHGKMTRRALMNNNWETTKKRERKKSRRQKGLRSFLFVLRCHNNMQIWRGKNDIGRTDLSQWKFIGVWGPIKQWFVKQHLEQRTAEINVALISQHDYCSRKNLNKSIGERGPYAWTIQAAWTAWISFRYCVCWILDLLVLQKAIPRKIGQWPSH